MVQWKGLEGDTRCQFLSSLQDKPASLLPETAHLQDQDGSEFPRAQAPPPTLELPQKQGQLCHLCPHHLPQLCPHHTCVTLPYYCPHHHHTSHICVTISHTGITITPTPVSPPPLTPVSPPPLTTVSLLQLTPLPHLFHHHLPHLCHHQHTRVPLPHPCHSHHTCATPAGPTQAAPLCLHLRVPSSNSNQHPSYSSSHMPYLMPPQSPCTCCSFCWKDSSLPSSTCLTLTRPLCLVLTSPWAEVSLHPHQ